MKGILNEFMEYFIPVALVTVFGFMVYLMSVLVRLLP